MRRPRQGFYEWQGATAPKQPWFIHRADVAPLLFAGLWEHWGSERDSVESFTIATTEANEFMAKLHTRMPCILEPEQIDAWMNAAPDHASSMLRPAADGILTVHTVGTRVGSVRNGDPSLIEPAT